MLKRALKGTRKRWKEDPYKHQEFVYMKKEMNKTAFYEH